MGKWVRVDRRYNQPFRLTSYAWWMILKWGTVVLAWLALASTTPWAGLLGLLALGGYGGYRWHASHRPKALPPPVTTTHLLPPPDAPLGQRNSRVIPQDVKIAVAARDGGRCRQCGSAEDLHFDHVIPWSKGGANTVANIQLLCGRCNRAKGADDIPATL